MHTNLFAKTRKLHILQLPILIFKKSIISDMQHAQNKFFYEYIQILLKIILNCMNLQIATQLIMMLFFNNHDENCYPVN